VIAVFTGDRAEGCTFTGFALVLIITYCFLFIPRKPTGGNNEIIEDGCGVVSDLGEILLSIAVTNLAA
jgi:hypothetical protein